MTYLQIFKNEEFGQIRTVILDGQPWFVGKDVAEILGYSNPQKAMRDHVDTEDKGVNEMDTPGGKQQIIVVNESGLYALVFSSQLDNAKKFKRWVTSEVIPSIRKNGGYIANQEKLTPEQIVANALIVAQNIIQQKDKQLADMKPKADFFDAVADSKSAVAIGDVAKVLGIKGIGRNNLFEILRDKKVLMSDNKPYQKYIDAGYFRVIEQKYTKPDGETVISFKTLVYQRGIDYIRRIVGGTNEAKSN